ncbi:type II secretion system F family protein [Globicatella sulfidifaciens]|uniref:Pilus assembly protein TadB n=1 Tax=Globicatella sulfidifaciens TaxID=136093 RepID=A0A7X8C5K4_9LACT|nr:type II secretion system F family protein [Globicatella sulfidifaciens]NLJ19341.1 pilus assembly protein TadB [Globicatella sulfidifaciens]
MLPLIFIIGLAIGLTILLIVLSQKKKKDAQPETERKPLSKQRESTSSEELTNYRTYHYSAREFIFLVVISAIFLFFVGYLFYQNIIISILFSSLSFFFPKLYLPRKVQKRKDELSFQFQQALFSLSSSLVAGRSIENAFIEVVKDLYLIYPDPETMIIKEFEYINKRVANREPIEVALKSFSDRADIEDIINFTDVFLTCKRTGGDLVEVIRRTSTMINEKLEIKQEIAVMVSQKKFESNIIAVVPFFIVAFLSYSSPDYMEPLYSWTNLGPIIMTISLVAILFAVWICQRIMNIKV